MLNNNIITMKLNGLLMNNSENMKDKAIKVKNWSSFSEIIDNYYCFEKWTFCDFSEHDVCRRF